MMIRARLVLFLVLASTGCALSGRVNVTGEQVAIHGYDTVAYFTRGRPLKGDPRFTQSYQGAVWRFANEKHRALFADYPEQYAPRYGGFCAYAMAGGSRADIDPTAWKIVGGKLYLNYDADIQKKWEAEEARMIQDADRHWRRLLAEDAAANK